MLSSHEKLGYVLGFIGVTIFAGSLPATRLAVMHLDPWFVTSARAAIAGLCALVLLDRDAPAAAAERRLSAAHADHSRRGVRLSVLHGARDDERSGRAWRRGARRAAARDRRDRRRARRRAAGARLLDRGRDRRDRGDRIRAAQQQRLVACRRATRNLCSRSFRRASPIPPPARCRARCRDGK